MPTDELEAVLTHELIHIKRKDAFLTWFLEIFFVSIPVLIIQVFALSFIYSVENSVYALLGALLSLVFFKAFLWQRILFLRELSCDDLCVSAISDSLVLASSIIHVWQLSKKVPAHRWTIKLAFAEELLSSDSRLEIRVRRLIDYRRPKLKFLMGKVFRFTAVAFLLLVLAFLWMFHTRNAQATPNVGADQMFLACQKS